MRSFALFFLFIVIPGVVLTIIVLFPLSPSEIAKNEAVIDCKRYSVFSVVTKSTDRNLNLLCSSVCRSNEKTTEGSFYRETAAPMVNAGLGPYATAGQVECFCPEGELDATECAANKTN